MRILIRTSKLAIWSRRLGSVALPLAVIPVLLHRERAIASDTFFLIEVIAIAAAMLAVLLALGAFVRLWITGDQGWMRALAGLAMGLICLVPPAYLLTEAMRYPMVADVTTNALLPPELVSAPDRARPDAATARAIDAAFPNLRTRTYPVDAGRIYALVSDLVVERGWEIRRQRQPQVPGDVGQINAIATRLLGWRDEVSIQIAGDAQGAVLDMRSVALSGNLDLGENGRRIEEFLLAVDSGVTVLLRDSPVSPPAEPAVAPTP
jgi:hypothetical protein